MKSKIIRNDFDGLNNFVKGVSTKKVVKVGIFGEKNARPRGDITNAEIGAKHEFGEGRVPMRSFLLMPILHEMGQILKDIKSAGVGKAIEAGKTDIVLKNIGVACEAAIDRAFGSDGFGEWAPLAPSTIARKLGRGLSLHQRKQLLAEVTLEGESGIVSILIDRGFLRKSIASKVGTP